ncbi:MAG: hypothetical protein ACXWV0_08635, partial [Flavisolibacter sp.]
MKLLCRILLLFILLTGAQVSHAQTPPSSNLRLKRITVIADTVFLDSLSIIPGSFVIKELDSSFYQLDYVHAFITWKKMPELMEVTAVYRVFPYRLHTVTQRLSYDSVINNVYLRPFEFSNNNTQGTKGLLDFGNIEASGSLGRELSFGNNQDAVINSNFQLQINGMLRDSIELSAAFTDNNIPIQPDGTTAQLNEFDRVFLQFKKKNWQLNLGDIDIRQNQMYFLNFYKRLQGISFLTTNQLSPSVRSTTLASGSIAKGKFNRNVFDRTTTPNMEGNQGPYRLTGANNEFFFIVLANTERVFLDGELLQRGEDQDYIINYNTAEITFMPRRMITKDSRIQVEFEYADRNYLNANIYLNQELQIHNKLKLVIGAFTNSDAKNSQVNQTLDTRQKQFLFDIGDSIQQALYPTIGLDTFSTDKILYEKVYYTQGSQTDSFYRYSIDPSLARYSLSFTDIGQGNGNYVADFSVGANGKVFRFVEPVNGEKQGQFEPVMVLVTPKKQQLLSFGTEYQVNKNNVVKTELAMSNYDVNTFSSKNGGDDAGMAARVQYENILELNAARKVRLHSAIDYEHVQQKFRPLERLRFVEFTREWGLPMVLPSATENILRLSSRLESPKQSLRYQFMQYRRSDNYKGAQNLLQHTADMKSWIFNNQLSLTSFNSFTGKGYFFRPVIDMSKQLRQLASMRVGFRYALEKNEVKAQSGDSLSAISFSFDTWSAFIKSDDKKQNRYGITFFTRSDKYPYGKELVRGDRSYNINLESQLLKSQHHQFLFNVTYRMLRVYNEAVSQQKNDNTMLGRAEYLVNEWKGLLTGNVLYELGTGQEQRRDFAYFEVPAGQGEYTWNDYDSNGVQTLNEFEIALFQDQAKFIRIFIPTNQFTKANYTTINYSFSINPKALFSNAEVRGFGKFISRFNLQTSMQKSKKSIARGDFEFNPFKYDIADTALLTTNTALLNNISFNRFSNKWGMDLSNVQNTSKALLTYGYESRRINDWIAKVRWNLSSHFTFDVVTRKGLNALYTPS